MVFNLNPEDIVTIVSHGQHLLSHLCAAFAVVLLPLEFSPAMGFSVWGSEHLFILTLERQF